MEIHHESCERREEVRYSQPEMKGSATRHQNNNGTPNPGYEFATNKNQISDSGVVYDAAGNMTTDQAGFTYTYDAENRMITANNGINVSTYWYDAVGRRYATNVGGTPREFLYDVVGRMIAMMRTSPSSWDRGEIYAGGWHIATYTGTGGTTHFNHADWLGTVRVRTGPAGAVLNSYSNFPFGDCFDQNGGTPCDNQVGSTPAHFTDQDRDSESGLDHFMFRQYSSTQGRWMSPDPADLAAVDPSNPQSWNRYAYANGNPTNAVDPLGLKVNLACPAGYCGGGGSEPSCLSCDGGLNPAYGPGAVVMDGVQVDPKMGQAALASQLGLYVVAKREAVFTTWACPHEFCGIYYAPGQVLYGVSIPGSDFVKLKEGWRDHLYDDGGPGIGNCTIAYGHLVHRGPCDGSSSESAYKKGISSKAGEQLFKQDLQSALGAVAAGYPWGFTQTQIDMLADFVFNAGAGNYAGRSGVGNLVRNGDSSLIPSFIMGWGAYGGSLGRRNQEATIFNWGYP